MSAPRNDVTTIPTRNRMPTTTLSANMTSLTPLVSATSSALAPPTRVRIIQALSRGELCVCEISEVVGLSVSAGSHQLRLLRSLHLVRAPPQGKLVFYELSAPFVLALLEDCTRHVQGKVTDS